MADWRESLDGFFEKAEQGKKEEEISPFGRFISEVAVPAFSELASELEKHGRTVTVRTAAESAAIIVHCKGEEEITYRIQSRTFPNGVLPYADVRFRERKGLRLIRTESMFRSGVPDYRLEDIAKEEIISNFLDHYTRRVHTD